VWSPNTDSIVKFSLKITHFNNEIIRRIHDITAFSNGCWKSQVGDVVIDGTLFHSNSWQNVCSLTLHVKTSCTIQYIVSGFCCSHASSSNMSYHQELWFIRWIRLHRRLCSWSVNIRSWNLQCGIFRLIPFHVHRCMVPR
jgi:hypothetical protein